MKRLTKDKIEQLGHVDGERYAKRWLAAHAAYEQELPTKEDIEWKMVSRVGQEETEDVGHASASSERDLDLHPNRRQTLSFYVGAFVRSAKRELNRAFLEAEWGPR